MKVVTTNKGAAPVTVPLSKVQEGAVILSRDTPCLITPMGIYSLLTGSACAGAENVIQVSTVLVARLPDGNKLCETSEAGNVVIAAWDSDGKRKFRASRMVGAVLFEADGATEGQALENMLSKEAAADTLQEKIWKALGHV